MHIDQLAKLKVVRRQRWLARVMAVTLGACAIIPLLIGVWVLSVLLWQSWHFFHYVNIGQFLTGHIWTPMFSQPQYGILPLLSATLWVAGIALLLAAPLGVLLAIYLSEFAPRSVRTKLRVLLELVQAVPSIIYGYFALIVLTPLIQRWLPELGAFNLLVPGLVVGIMILPYVVSVSDDAMRAFPVEIREGAYAVGMSRWQTAWRVILPGASSAVLAGMMLAMARALGEIMIVSIAAGQMPVLVADPRQGAATMTSYMLQMSMGDLPQGGLAYQAIFAIGLALLILTMLFNLLGALVLRRFRGHYGYH
jgi:phosphate transport system permease protein